MRHSYLPPLLLPNLCSSQVRLPLEELQYRNLPRETSGLLEEVPPLLVQALLSE